MSFANSREPRQGEIWYVALDPTQGAEIQKTRPCVVISQDKLSPLPLRLVVPITTWQEKFSRQLWKVRLLPDEDTGLENESAADTLQTRSVDLQRFHEYAGTLSVDTLEAIVAALAFAVRS